MQFICHSCWGYKYFEVDVETLKELKTGKDGVIVQDSKFEDFNYSESMLRENLSDIVQYVLKQDAAALVFDHETGGYLNNYISCARCGSKRVTKPYSPWSHRHQPLERELLENHKEFKELRKERDHENRMPVMWKEF